MKKLIYGLSLAAVVLFTGGCEKDSITSSRKKEAGASEKSIPTFDLTVGYSCGGQVCGMYDFNPMPKYNMLIMGRTNKIYPVTYTLYERNYVSGGVEVYAPFDQFTCSDEESRYAGPLVNNNVKVLVIGTDAAYTAPNTTDNVVLIGGTLYPPVSNSSYSTVMTPGYEGQTCN